MNKTASSQSTDSSYGKAALQVDLTSPEMDQACQDFMARLAVSEQEQQQLASRTTLQADDPNGEWERQRSIRATASHFGEICK